MLTATTPTAKGAAAADVEVVPDLEDLLIMNNASSAVDDLMVESNEGDDDDDFLMRGSFASATYSLDD